MVQVEPARIEVLAATDALVKGKISDPVRSSRPAVGPV